jgi:hypothetical protein
MFPNLLIEREVNTLEKDELKNALQEVIENVYDLRTAAWDAYDASIRTGSPMASDLERFVESIEDLIYKVTGYIKIHGALSESNG